MQRSFQIMMLFIVAVFIGISCSKSSSNNSGGGGGNNNPTPGCSGTPGTLFSAVRTIVTVNCAISGCHVQASAASAGGLNFSDNCVVVANATRIRVRAVDQHGTSTQMPPPPSPGLSASDRQAITAWVAAGGRLTD